MFKLFKVYQLNVARKSRQGAAPRKRRSKANNVNIKWIWLLSGILAGVLIASSIFMKFSPTNKAIRQPIAQQKKTSNKTKQHVTKKEDKFDFYTMLAKDGSQTNKAHLDLTTKDTHKVNSYKYYVQAGSFKKNSEADELKAKLTLEGFEAKIESTSKQGAMWHRVIIGPFASIDKALNQKTSLSKHNVKEALILKRDEQLIN